MNINQLISYLSLCLSANFRLNVHYQSTVSYHLSIQSRIHVISQ